jgi:hypothetical protein
MTSTSVCRLIVSGSRPGVHTHARSTARQEVNAAHAPSLRHTNGVDHVSGWTDGGLVATICPYTALVPAIDRVTQARTINKVDDMTRDLIAIMNGVQIQLPDSVRAHLSEVEPGPRRPSASGTA